MDLGLNLNTIMMLVIAAVALVLIGYDNHCKRNSLDAIVKGKEITPKDFSKLLRKNFWASSKIPKYRKYDVPGVYVFFNKTKEKYLIGQSPAAMSMVNQHLTGHGDVTLCGDYMSGDYVTIRIINLAGSGYFSLDELQSTVEEPYKENGFESY